MNGKGIYSLVTNCRGGSFRKKINDVLYCTVLYRTRVDLLDLPSAHDT